MKTKGKGGGELVGRRAKEREKLRESKNFYLLVLQRKRKANTDPTQAICLLSVIVKLIFKVINRKVRV